jgi:hypothetical protein
MTRSSPSFRCAMTPCPNARSDGSSPRGSQVGPRPGAGCQMARMG